MDLDFWLKVIPPFVQVVAVLVTATVAVTTLRAWREQTLGKRQIEIAEQASIAIVKVGWAFASIRFYGHEAREIEASEDAKLSDHEKLRALGRAWRARLDEALPSFQALQASSLLVRALFGRDVSDKLDELLKLRSRMAATAEFYFDPSKDERWAKVDRERNRRDVFSIWAKDEPNKFTAEIEQAVTRALDAMSSHLTVKRGSWW